MCGHRNSDVFVTRRLGQTAPDGQPVIGPRRYPFLCRRRRKCRDCGARFVTYEVPEDYLEAVMDRLPESGRLRGLLGDVRAYLEGLQDVTTTTTQPQGDDQ